MREFDFLPYKQAIENMAKEYKNITPIKPAFVKNDKKEKEDTDEFSNFLLLENTYCNNIELSVLLKQLSRVYNSKDIIDLINKIINDKNISIKKLSDIYYKLSSTTPPSPICSNYRYPRILRRIMNLQTIVVSNLEKINANYHNVNILLQNEIKTLAYINNLILLITCV